MAKINKKAWKRYELERLENLEKAAQKKQTMNKVKYKTFFLVSYIATKLGGGQITGLISMKSNVSFLNRELSAEAINAKTDTKMLNIVITNIMELTKEQYYIWESKETKL